MPFGAIGYHMKTKPQQKYRHSEHVSWRRVEDEAVVLDLNTSVYFSLNEIGAMIWERLGAGDSPEQIQAAVYEEYDVEPSLAWRHIEALVAQMLGEKLLSPV